MLGAFGCVIVSLALAADPAEGTDRRALDLFEQSAQAYREGRFEDAIRLLTEARGLKPEPVLLYDLGRAYEAAGHGREAADAYARYLAEEPNARDRASLEARIGTLRRAEEERQALLRRSRETPPPREPGRATIGPLPFIVAGAGVATLAGGALLGVLAQSRASDARSEPVQTRASELHDGARSLAVAANITLVAGAVLAVAGATWIGVKLLNPPRQTGAAAGSLVWVFP